MSSASASEKDELALVMRQLDQLQASLDRAQSLSVQDAGEGRFYFDYARATGDLRAMKQGILQYLDRVWTGSAVGDEYRDAVTHSFGDALKAEEVKDNATGEEGARWIGGRKLAVKGCLLSSPPVI